MNNRIVLSLGALAATLSVLAGADQIPSPRARLTVRVLSEHGSPLQGAHVTFTFFDPLTRQGVPISGMTNSDGLFSGEGVSDPKIGGQIKMDGYYSGGFPFEPFRDVQDGRWIPWDAVATTVLRKIGYPVPLSAKTGWIEIPSVGEACGYDLEHGDWVVPYGKGTVSDFIFMLERRYVSRQNFEVIVALGFSQEGDGIQNANMPEAGKYSRFKWARQAPESGYESKLITRFAHPEGGTYEQTASPEQNYFFRVRTEKLNGRITKAHYGKIAGGLQLAPSNSKTCKIKLTYYFNPAPQDRNLEWDPTRNLIPGLKFDETPREP